MFTYSFNKVLYKFNSKFITTLSLVKNDMTLMKKLTPKQLGKIAVDVSKCANSDIRIWDTFVESCKLSLNTFDSKDVLRVLRGLNSIYMYLDYEIRKNDCKFVDELIDLIFSCTESYSCNELAEITEVITKFSLSDPLVASKVANLFSKIAILFKMRIAEAVPLDIVKASVSFSKLGIRDEELMRALCNYVCSTNQFGIENLCILLTSCALLEYSDSRLLKLLIDYYYESGKLNDNELGILSFICSRLNFKEEKVVELFERSLKHEINLADAPNFCINLYRLGINVPTALIDKLQIDILPRDVFFDVLPLLPKSNGTSAKDIKIVYSSFITENEIKEYTPDYLSTSMDKETSISNDNEHLNVLKYVLNSNFNNEVKELFNIAIRLIKDVTRGDVIKLLIGLPHSWVSESRVLERIELNNITVHDLNDIVLLFVTSFKGDISRLNAIFSVYNTNIDDIVLNILSNKRKRAYTLVADLQTCGLEFTSLVEKFPNNDYLNTSKGVVLPIYPDDLLAVDCSIEYPWLPKGFLPRMPLLLEIYFIKSRGYPVIPIVYNEWRDLLNSKEMLNYLNVKASQLSYTL